MSLDFLFAPSLEEKGFSELMQSKGIATIRADNTGLPSYMSTFLNQFSPKLKPSFLIGSFTTVRKIATLGEAIAILPKRIASVESGDLVEVFPEQPLKSKGSHTLSLVSEKYCDREEADFLAEKLIVVCNSPSSYLQ